MLHIKKGRPFQLFIAIACTLMCTRIALAGLTITPSFASNITSDANAASIENVINQAIGVYQSQFSDPITVTISFQEMSSGLGSSNWWYYNMPYQTVINRMVADKTSASDTTALAHLPTGANNPVDNGTTFNIKTANIRALGIAGSFPSGLAGGVDGIIGLNTHITDVGSPGGSGDYSLLATVEHEVDEVLGLSSSLDGSLVNGAPLPEDLFRYNSSFARSYTRSGDNAYLSIDAATALVRLNQGNNAGGDYGDWWSNNGGGNPGPNPPTQVQDAFAFPGRHPTLGTPEITALDVIGYDLAPEPSAAMLVACASVFACARRQRIAKSA